MVLSDPYIYIYTHILMFLKVVFYKDYYHPLNTNIQHIRSCDTEE